METERYLASSQQPAASSQQPAASSQQPAASSQQPAASSQQDHPDAARIKFNLVTELIREEYLSSAQNYPWIIGFSGGKDSTLVAHAIFIALLGIEPALRTRPVHIVSNDTLVESPLVVAHLKATLAQIATAAVPLNLPVQTAITAPSPEQSFWVNLIGRGYPSPNMKMRWCTDRLKIQPTSRYIIDFVSKCGAAIVVLGVRRDESSSRRNSIDRHKNQANSNLTPHSELMGAYIFRPIVNLTTDEVWEILGSLAPPWGGSHAALIQLYREASGGECPVVLSKEEAPGCGTNSSRFGCWTCTVVNKDKSLQGFIDSGRVSYHPLVEFRDWLVSIRDNSEYRQVRRRNGRVTFTAKGYIPGPFTVKARRMILEKLLETQARYGEELINTTEIQLIRRIWTEDLLKTHTEDNHDGT